MTRGDVARVLAVVVTWNNAQTIDGCLDSLSAQERVSCRTIVVDNSSADDTVGRAQKHDVVVISNEENTGFAKAANQGAQHLLPGEHLLLLNPDAALAGQDFLHRAIQRLEADARVATVGPRTVLPTGETQPTAFPVPTLWREVVEAAGFYALIPHAARARLLLGAHFDHTEEVTAGWLLGACLLIRGNVWTMTGGLTEDFHMFAEDLEWGIRMLRLGKRNLFLPELVLQHESNHSGARAYGARRSEVSYDSYYAYLRSREGRVRELASIAVNGVAFSVRALLYRTLLRNDADRAARADECAELASFHFQRLRQLGRVDGATP